MAVTPDLQVQIQIKVPKTAILISSGLLYPIGWASRICNGVFFKGSATNRIQVQGSTATRTHVLGCTATPYPSTELHSYLYLKQVFRRAAEGLGWTAVVLGEDLQPCWWCLAVQQVGTPAPAPTGDRPPPTQIIQLEEGVRS
jgi:hypothetical protein